MTVPGANVALMMIEKDHRALRTVFKNLPKLISQQYKDQPLGIGVSRNNFIYSLLEKALTPLVEAGIPQYFLDFMLKFYMKVIEEDPSEPKVFSVDDLSFGFIVWVLTCGISIAAFILEVSWVWAKKTFKDLHAIYRIGSFLQRGFI
jgi:hypothetical protein